ncbi:hypothetical protein EF903_16575 [Streptomyces sp. WAC05292]|uniref:hypothetical protein n=1 Tax=Streptomyces sp. WAC05292 TaxID=2487418 RepID=UPI000F741621|nr:hypothetical protein [Streptomyces sp. WAC05292]RSS87932.1 hypothetical protein EF903_16575 [Streptomyces sp. WAC05292]
MEQSILVESVTYSAACQGCGAVAEWCGVQALVGGTLRWDAESTCSTCGVALAVCGGALPDDVRSRLLCERGRGRARLRVSGPAGSATVMRVLRAEFGIGLDGVKAVLTQVLSGEYPATLPEMELLARKLRASGVDAIASRTVD